MSTRCCKARFPAPLLLWVLFLSICNAAGWALSFAHFLTPAGFLVIFAFTVAVLLLLRSYWVPSMNSRCRIGKLRRRFSRPLPLTYLVLAVFALAGGLLYAPNNYDALAYRTPRVLHWLAAQRWHWIHTEFQRLNVRGCGFEWASTPLIAWFQTDRFIFLINFLSFCLLPGCAFSLFRRLGVAPRPAYSWMWILPGAYGFILQAGSVSNDLLAAFLVLASLQFALHAAQQQSLSAFWLSGICAALFTSVKANNLPLLLVWAVAAWPAWRLAISKPARTVAVLLLVMLISFAPTAVLNQRHTHDWTGGKAEHVEFQSKAAIWARPIGNLCILAVHSFMPPIAPFAKIWNTRIAPKLLPRQVSAQVANAFMGGATVWQIPELEIEEEAGLGFGVSGLFVLSTLLTLLNRPASRGTPARGVPASPPASSGRGATRWRPWFLSQPALIAMAAWLAFAALLQASSVRSAARLSLAYYPLLLFPLLLLRGQSKVSRFKLFSALGVLAGALAALLLLISPARPLIPVKSLLAFAHEHGFKGALFARAERVYSVYSERANAFEPALRLLPPGLKVLGMITYDDPEAAMWRPFGSRKIVHLCTTDGPDEAKMYGVEYIWVHPRVFTMLWHETFDAWLRRMHGEVTQEVTLNLRAGDPEEKWQLVRLE
jgi:hypothetical protein